MLPITPKKTMNIHPALQHMYKNRRKSKKRKNRMCFVRKKARKHLPELIKKYNNRCYLCNIELKYGKPGIDFHNKRTIDHIIPIYKGGTSSIDNLALCCSRCNTDKGNLLPEVCKKCSSYKIPEEKCRKC